MTFQDSMDRCGRHAHLLGDLTDRGAFLAERQDPPVLWMVLSGTTILLLQTVNFRIERHTDKIRIITKREAASLTQAVMR